MYFHLINSKLEMRWANVEIVFWKKIFKRFLTGSTLGAKWPYFIKLNTIWKFTLANVWQTNKDVYNFGNAYNYIIKICSTLDANSYLYTNNISKNSYANVSSNKKYLRFLTEFTLGAKLWKYIMTINNQIQSTTFQKVKKAVIPSTMWKDFPNCQKNKIDQKFS